MTRFTKMYESYKKSKENKIPKIEPLKRVGSGYIKRRLGLLSNEVEKSNMIL